MLKRVLIAMALVVAPCAAVAGPYEDGKAAYDRGEYTVALELYRQAAESGIADAQLLLGFLYFNGETVGKDYANALKWFTKAAGQGDARSEAQLGIMYENGTGVPQDYRKAAQWFRKSAEKNFGLSQNSLGLLYAVGKGVGKDFTQAHVWLNLAAAQGFQDAKENRDEVAKRMTPEQIVQAQKMAREWLTKRSQ